MRSEEEAPSVGRTDNDRPGGREGDGVPHPLGEPACVESGGSMERVDQARGGADCLHQSTGQEARGVVRVNQVDSTVPTEAGKLVQCPQVDRSPSNEDERSFEMGRNLLFEATAYLETAQIRGLSLARECGREVRNGVASTATREGQRQVQNPGCQSASQDPARWPRLLEFVGRGRAQGRAAGSPCTKPSAASRIERSEALAFRSLGIGTLILTQRACWRWSTAAATLAFACTRRPCRTVRDTTPHDGDSLHDVPPCCAGPWPDALGTASKTGQAASVR